mmetsp:Transcript_29424/g.35008  ORF Transcript_29424/g.35008 Transcript_29424/m.35008 type:complete len:108 (-) Transcript_29424:69-392(-)
MWYMGDKQANFFYTETKVYLLVPQKSGTTRSDGCECEEHSPCIVKSYSLFASWFEFRHKRLKTQQCRLAIDTVLWECSFEMYASTVLETIAEVLTRSSQRTIPNNCA